MTEENSMYIREFIAYIYAGEDTDHHQKMGPTSLYHTEKSASGSYESIEMLTSLTPTPAYVHNAPFSTTVPACGDLHLKFVLRDANRFKSRFEYVVVGWHISQRSNTLKVIQKAYKTH